MVREAFSSPELHVFLLNCVSCSSGNEKNLNFLIGRSKMNAQQDKKITLLSMRFYFRLNLKFWRVFTAVRGSTCVEL